MPEAHDKTSRQEYKSRLQKVITYMEAHSQEAISDDTLAEISQFAPRYFPRVFRAMMGEIPQVYLQRLRLEKAAEKLIKEHTLKVSEIAETVGYDPADFTQDFKDMYGIPPSEFRRGVYELPAQPGRGENYLPTVHPIRQPQVEMLEPIPVVYIATVRGHQRENMRSAREAINQWAKQHGLIDDHNRFIGISVDDPFYTDLEQCRYYAAVSVPQGLDAQPEPPIEMCEVAGGPYLAARFSCSRSQVKHAYYTLFREYLPDCGYDLADQPYFDVYLTLHDDNTENPTFTFDIYLPLREL